jgi:hypothetical protein
MISMSQDDVRRKILVPVHDDAWAPHFTCGQFAIVDTGDRAPTENDFFCIRQVHGEFRIIRVERWKLGKVRARGPIWSENYGRQAIRRADFSTTEEFLYMCDGPLPDKHMRERIVGRAVGVLGEKLTFLPSRQD